jgi:hypothetical protein
MPMSAGPDTRSITDSAQEAFELRRSHCAGFVRALVAAPSGLGGLAYYSWELPVVRLLILKGCFKGAVPAYGAEPVHCSIFIKSKRCVSLPTLKFRGSRF